MKFVILFLKYMGFAGVGILVLECFESPPHNTMAALGIGFVVCKLTYYIYFRIRYGKAKALELPDKNLADECRKDVG